MHGSWFLLLLLFPHSALSSSCSLVDIEVADASDRPQRCVSAAAAQRRATAAVSGKGSCLVCGPVSSDRLPKQCASYKAVAGPGGRLLLLRTKAGGPTSPYHLLKFGKNSEQVLVAAGSADSYRSPLLDTAHQVGVSELQLQLVSGTGSVVVSLNFSLTESVKTGEWFSKARLQSVYPWSLETMRGQTFNYFSATGLEEGLVIRRFYISMSHDGCENDKGYMLVADKRSCAYETASSTNPAFLWQPNPGSRWIPGTPEAEVFQLFGVLDGDSRVYNVMPVR